MWRLGLKLCFLLLITTAACDMPPRTMAPEFTKAAFSEWSVPVNVVVVNSPFIEQQPVLSPDGLALYFASGRPGGVGGNDIWVSQRATTDSPWGAPANLGATVNSADNDQSPALSHDGHLLFFQSARPGGRGMVDLYVSRRSKKDDFDWQSPTPLGTDVNTDIIEAHPWYQQNLEPGQGNLYFVRGPNPADGRIYAAPITRDGETRGPAVPVDELNFAVAGFVDARPSVDKNGREVVFYSSRPGGYGMEDLYIATRQNPADDWSTPVNPGSPVNTAHREFQPSLSLDGRILLFVSTRPGGLGMSDVWMSTRIEH